MYNNQINTSLGLPHSNNLGCLFDLTEGLVSELPLLLSLSTHLTPKYGELIVRQINSFVDQILSVCKKIAHRENFFVISGEVFKSINSPKL